LQTGAVSQVLYYQQNIVTPGAGEALSVEATVKVVSSSTSSAARTAIGITAIRGANVGMTLFLGNDEAFILAADNTRGAAVAVDTNDAPHTWRLEVTGAGAVTVTYDGTAVLAGTALTSSGMYGGAARVWWGDGTGYSAGQSRWASVATSAATTQGCATTYAYDDDGRLATVTSAGQATSYAYDPAGHPTTIALPAATGHTGTLTWDRDARPTSITWATPTGTTASAATTYDPAGNPLTETDHTGAATTYTYDTRNQLTGACWEPTCTLDYATWSYDPAGNRLTETTPAGTTTHAYNTADQLTATTGPAGTTTYTYDPRGNLTAC